MRALPTLDLLRPPTPEPRIRDMEADVRARAENRPAVYRMIAADGEVVYVGKSKQLRSRLLSYFRGAFPEDKGARILRDADRIEWEYVPSEFAALLAELRAIKQHRPRRNVAMKSDAKNLCFIKLTGGVAPRLAVVRGPGTDDRALYYGPFLGAANVADSARELSDVLGLRDCTLDKKMRFSDQAELFHLAPRTPGCLRYEVKKCLGPCIAACSSNEYMDRVALARKFLDGTDDGPIETLRNEMLGSSERLEFERAAAYRDKLQRLEALRTQFGRLRFAVEALSFVYTVPGFDGADRLYVIRRGRVRAELPPPRTTDEQLTLEHTLRQIFADAVDGMQVPSHEIDELLLLSSWFRRFPRELDRTVPVERVS
ncbi:MAG TPA: UvrB/UvrC motif-containing protein [Gemmatimonadaceae bacterium]|nr:UvrB/UvrC motif-containing protein [Gemmatimonadaceae bacterium]